MPLLEVRDLRTTFQTDDGPVGAVDGVSFELERGKVLGIVGESGSGKSVTSLSIMGLLSRPRTRIERRGDVRRQGPAEVSDAELREIRGDDMAMIFQDPMTSLNPVYTIGRQLEEAVLQHRDVSQREARARSREMLAAVGIPRPEERVAELPARVLRRHAPARDDRHGAAQRPGHADRRRADDGARRDTQAQILKLIRRLRKEFDSAIIMITHDLGVVAEICDDVLVMYAGRVVEQGTVDEIFERPQHPYTWGLLGSMPGRVAVGGR